jgi:hypothetical protein
MHFAYNRSCRNLSSFDVVAVQVVQTTCRQSEVVEETHVYLRDGSIREHSLQHDLKAASENGLGYNGDSQLLQTRTRNAWQAMTT